MLTIQLHFILFPLLLLAIFHLCIRFLLLPPPHLSIIIFISTAFNFAATGNTAIVSLTFLLLAAIFALFLYNDDLLLTSLA